MTRNDSFQGLINIHFIFSPYLVYLFLVRHNIEAAETTVKGKLEQLEVYLIRQMEIITFTTQQLATLQVATFGSEGQEGIALGIRSFPVQKLAFICFDR